MSILMSIYDNKHHKCLLMHYTVFPSGGSRGFVQGRLWRQDGVLAASCAQEGVIRVKAVPQSKL